MRPPHEICFTLVSVISNARTKSHGPLERRPEEWKRHDENAEWRLRGPVLIFIALRGRNGDEPRGTDRSRACRLLLDGTLGQSEQSGLRARPCRYRGNRAS